MSVKADETVVRSGSATATIVFEVVKIAKCDGEHDHYYWRALDSDTDASDCWPTADMAESDAHVSLVGFMENSI